MGRVIMATARVSTGEAAGSLWWLPCSVPAGCRAFLMPSRTLTTSCPPPYLSCACRLQGIFDAIKNAVQNVAEEKKAEIEEKKYLKEEAKAMKEEKNKARDPGLWGLAGLGGGGGRGHEGGEGQGSAHAPHAVAGAIPVDSPVPCISPPGRCMPSPAQCLCPPPPCRCIPLPAQCPCPPLPAHPPLWRPRPPAHRRWLW